MNLLPQDIRHKVFSKKTIGGVSNEEVSTFLLELSNEFEKLKHQNRSLSNQIVQLNNELSRYRDIENKLFVALENGKEINERTKANAEEEARLIINKGKFQAHEILKEARSKAQKILERTEKYCRERITATDQKVKVKKEEIERLEFGRKKVIAELNHFMNKTLGKIKRLSETSAFRFSPKHESVPPNIDWSYEDHFDNLVKKKQVDIPTPVTSEPEQSSKQNVCASDNKSIDKTEQRSINEQFNKKSTTIHERFIKRKSMDE